MTPHEKSKENQTIKLFENLEVKARSSHVPSQHGNPNVIGNSHEHEDMSDPINDLSEPLLPNEEAKETKEPKSGRVTKLKPRGRPRKNI